MTTIGSANYEAVGKNALLTLTPSGGSTSTLAAAKTWTIKGGYKVHEEPVCYSDTPRVIHGVFHAEFTSEQIFTTDDTLFAMGFPSTRDVVITGVSTDTDTNSSPGSKTITFSMKASDFERTGPPNADGVVKGKLTGILNARPTIA